MEAVICFSASSRSELIQPVPGVADHIVIHKSLLSDTEVRGEQAYRIRTCGSGLQPGHVTDWHFTTCSALLRVGAEAPTHMFQRCRIASGTAGATCV